MANRLDRAIAYLAPAWGRKRAANRNAFRALYEAGEPSRLRRQKARPASGDVAVARAGTRIRDNARYLEENLDIAKGALDVLVANIVGPGIRPEPAMLDLAGNPADEQNAMIAALWKHWARRPETTGEMDLAELQRKLVRSTLRDGEAFTQMIAGSAPGLKRTDYTGAEIGVPFWVRLFESDFVDLADTQADKGIQQGIKLGPWNNPLEYYLYKAHPSGLVFSNEKFPVKAADLVHSKLTTRVGQLRGVSIFAAVINRLDDIKEIDETERVAARVAAAMAAFIKKGTPDMFEGAGDEYRVMDITPGMIIDDLEPGEEIGTINSNRPNNALIPFRDSQLRSAAAGLGVSFSSLSKNYNGTYSAQRQELVEQYSHYGVLWSYFARHSFQRIYERFVDSAISAGLVNAAGVDPFTVYDCQHSRPPLVWIDPVKEATANEILRRNNWRSDGQIIRDRGDDPAETWRQVARDQADQDAAGIDRAAEAPAGPAESDDADE